MDEGQGKSREEILAAIKAKADAIRAQRTSAPPSGQPAPSAAATSLETPVSSLNAAGRPFTKAQNSKVKAFATVSQGVELTVDKLEDENVKKLLGGLGAYQNPLRRGVWQLDYRYYEEAKRRLTQAGYVLEEDQYGRIPLKQWSPQLGGWSKVER
jgi:hypothetical protein